MLIGISGANGFVGQALCHYLLKSCYKPIAITRKTFVLSAAVNRVVPDFTNQTTMTNALEGCHALVILASKTHSGTIATNKNLLNFKKNTLDTAVASLKAAASASVERVIYLSSIKVNGEQTHGKPFTYDSTPNPGDAYGIVKYETEQLLTQIAGECGIELVIIRSPLIYGTDVRGNLQLLGRIVNKGTPLPFATLQNKRDLIALPVLCDLITTCIHHPQAAGEIFLAADGTPRSTPEIVKLVSDSHKGPILFPCPEGLLRVFGRLLGKQEMVRRLISDLEIDISHTCDTLDWDPGHVKIDSGVHSK